MSFLTKNPEVVRATRAYCELLVQKPSPIGQFLNRFNELSDKIAWAILAESLHQGIGEDWLIDLLQELSLAYPNGSLWALPAPISADLVKVFNRFIWVKEWALEPHYQGIIYSVGRWVRQFEQDSFCLSVKSQSTEMHWKALSKIYFMGKTSVIRPKVLSTIQRWQLPDPIGLDLKLQMNSKQREFWPSPITNGARRWFKTLGPNRVEWLSKQEEKFRLEYFQKMYAMITPQNPGLAAHALSFFLTRSKSGFLCKDVLGGCLNCPIAQMSVQAGACPGKQV